MLEWGNYLWDKRWYIGKIALGFLLLGLIIALFSRPEYESTSTLLLEEEDTQGQVNQLMQQFGVGSTSNNDSDALPTDIYPEIIEAIPFQMNLIGNDITFSEPDTVVNAYSYFSSILEPSTFENVYDYTFGLPWQIKKIVAGREPQEASGEFSRSFNFDESLDQIYQVGGDTLNAINELRNRTTVTVSSGGRLEIIVEMPDPVAAAEVGQNTVELLKEYIKGYKTKKATENLEYAQIQLESAREEFENAQQNLAEFKDSNVNLATAKAQTREQQLQSEYELAFGVYNSLATKVEDLKLRVQEKTPSFTVIHPFEIPRNPSSPNTKLILFISLFMGLLIGFFSAIGSKVWNIINN